MPSYIKKTEEQFPQLTKGLKKVANHLLQDPTIFAIHPAKKIGDIIGVSETMVIRFCNSIGYDGFSSLQDEIRKSLMTLSSDASDIWTSQDNDSNFIVEEIKEDIKLLTNNAKKINIENAQEVVDTIINSEKIIISGYYQSYSFAHWLFFNLNYILGNTSLYRPEIDARVLEFLPKKSSVILFSFYRYALDTIRLAKDAKMKGIKIIAFTDSRVSPIVEYADHIILVSLENASIFRKGPVTLSIINSLLYEIIRRIDGVEEISPTFKYFIKENQYDKKSGD
ncbi:MurR/RpiR family transcriptional regulator [Cytobacillus horneckiae]|nr:MurR/RpiR family transcriptional regulator [Cytobacillus horneckiae]